MELVIAFENNISECYHGTDSRYSPACYRFGDIKITDFCAQGKTCGRSINVVQDGKQHGETVTHGGHNEENKDARLAFGDHMIMWKSPNTYDVLYEIKFVTADAASNLLAGESNSWHFFPYAFANVTLLVNLSQVRQTSDDLLGHWPVRCRRDSFVHGPEQEDFSF